MRMKLQKRMDITDTDHRMPIANAFDFKQTMHKYIYTFVYFISFSLISCCVLLQCVCVFAVWKMIAQLQNDSIESSRKLQVIKDLHMTVNTDEANKLMCEYIFFSSNFDLSHIVRCIRNWNSFHFYLEKSSKDWSLCHRCNMRRL